MILIACKTNHDQQEIIIKLTDHSIPYYNYIKSLINPITGLVSSRTNECYTTVYKNSLAAMAFIHQGDSISAQGILTVFNDYYSLRASGFLGFPQNWDACTGNPTNTNYWEGDNAFLLLALNYYSSVFKNSGKYLQLRQGLASWLLHRGDYSSAIISEGLADMYAALTPFDTDSLSHARLVSIRYNFYKASNFPDVLDHTVRGALVFCDTIGYKYLNNFIRTDTWAYNDSTTVTAYSAFHGDSYINIEISAQVLLTDKIFNKDNLMSQAKLLSELSKVSLASLNNPEITGLPYYVITPVGVNWNPASLPIIDPSCYMLFYYWNFNPFAPGKTCCN
jgi:hypothetical protein